MKDVNSIIGKRCARFDEIKGWIEKAGVLPIPNFEVISMGSKETKLLHGWDNEKVYFWDEECGKERCVSDEEKLYNQLVEICREYFRKSNKIGHHLNQSN